MPRWWFFLSFFFLFKLWKAEEHFQPGNYQKPRKELGLRLVGLPDKMKMNSHSTTRQGSSMRRGPSRSGENAAPLGGRAPRGPVTPPSRPPLPRDGAGDTLYLPPAPASSCRAAAPVTAAARSASQPAVPARPAAPTPTSNRSPQPFPFAPPIF